MEVILHFTFFRDSSFFLDVLLPVHCFFLHSSNYDKYIATFCASNLSVTEQKASYLLATHSALQIYTITVVIVWKRVLVYLTLEILKLSVDTEGIMGFFKSLLIFEYFFLFVITIFDPIMYRIFCKSCLIKQFIFIFFATCYNV